MKQLTFTLLALLTTFTLLVGQQVPRENVVIEIGTATW